MIKLVNATKVFDARGIAGLHSINLEIPKASIFALMGPNGSGKTTLLKALSNKLEIDSGSISVLGKIHFFEKRTPSSEMNVQKFLVESVFHDVDQEKKIQLSRDMADIFEFTYQLRQTIGQLSQGQLQKVLMAAELINQPDILFLDEPFVHMDPMTRIDILDYLFTYLRQRETTVVWVTHEKDEALRFADLVGLIQHGKLEQVATPYKILQSPRNIFVAQFFGHQNLIKISRESGRWISPWGYVTSSLDAEEAFLVVPPAAWEIDPESNFEVKVLKKFPQYFVCELEVEHNEKRFKVALSLDQFEQIKLGQKLNLRARLQACILLPL